MYHNGMSIFPGLGMEDHLLASSTCVAAFHVPNFERSGLSNDSFTWWRYWFRNGNAADIENPRRVSGSHNEHILRGAESKSVRHGQLNIYHLQPVLQ